MAIGQDFTQKIMACVCEREEVFQVEAGARLIDAVNGKGKTALMLASAVGNSIMVKHLIAANAGWRANTNVRTYVKVCVF